MELDMENSHDRLEWEFIKKCFQDLGFRDRRTNWLMQCICTPLFRVIVNGKTIYSFHPERGITHGDLLSP